MKAELKHQEIPSRTIQSKRNGVKEPLISDNRNIAQMKIADTIQRVGLLGDEEEAIQQKSVTQLQSEEEDLL